MPVAVTINPGDQVTQDPSDARIYIVDWDYNLATGVQIAESDWSVRSLRPTFTDAGLTTDNDLLLTAAQATTALGRSVAADDRVSQVRISGGRLHQVYEVANRIVTTETPSQTKERSFRLLVAQQ